MERSGRLVPVGRVGDAQRARIIAARLESEGIAVRVHSEASGPYPFTVGHMAIAELWVPEHQLEAARELMLAAEVDDTLGSAQAWASGVPSWSWTARIVAAATAVIIVTLWARRFVSLLVLG